MNEMALRLKDWALGHRVWDDLCQKGEFYSIERVENETGISKNDLIRRLRYGLEIKNHQNRIQRARARCMNRAWSFFLI